MGTPIIGEGASLVVYSEIGCPYAAGTLGGYVVSSCVSG